MSGFVGRVFFSFEERKTPHIDSCGEYKSLVSCPLYYLYRHLFVKIERDQPRQVFPGEAWICGDCDMVVMHTRMNRGIRKAMPFYCRKNQGR